MGRERELITVAKARPVNDVEDQYRGGSGNQAVVAGPASPGCPGGTEGPGSSKAQVGYGGFLPLNLLPTVTLTTLPVTGFRKIGPEGTPPRKVWETRDGIEFLSLARVPLHLLPAQTPRSE